MRSHAPRRRRAGREAGPWAGLEASTRRRSGQRDFTEHVLRAWAYAGAMCGFDGRLGRHPVGIRAAHICWQSHHGPDDLDNELALCAISVGRQRERRRVRD